MADVVQIAKDRRKWLAAEIAKLDEFIQTAEALMKWHEAEADRKPVADEKVIGQSGGSTTLRTGSVAGSTTAGAA